MASTPKVLTWLWSRHRASTITVEPPLSESEIRARLLSAGPVRTPIGMPGNCPDTITVKPTWCGTQFVIGARRGGLNGFIWRPRLTAATRPSTTGTVVELKSNSTGAGLIAAGISCIFGITLLILGLLRLIFDLAFLGPPSRYFWLAFFFLIFPILGVATADSNRKDDEYLMSRVFSVIGAEPTAPSLR